MALKIRRPDDFHVHFRQGSQMGYYVRATAHDFARALVMPNTLPPVTTPAGLVAYAGEIRDAAPGFVPLMSFYILQGMERSQLSELKTAGAVAGKLYPKGATTNSDEGSDDISALFPVFEEMQRLGLILCIHGEDPDAPILEREIAFLPVIAEIIRTFPDLRVVLEHVSTLEALEFVLGAPVTLAATVTAHHLLLTLDDLLGERLNPHCFCKPVVKTAERPGGAQGSGFFRKPEAFSSAPTALLMRVKRKRTEMPPRVCTRRPWRFRCLLNFSNNTGLSISLRTIRAVSERNFTDSHSMKAR